MSPARPSAAWLSDNMARALAAWAPPLTEGEVIQAADELALLVADSAVVAHLLEQGPDPLTAQQLVEVLRALQQLGN